MSRGRATPAHTVTIWHTLVSPLSALTYKVHITKTKGKVSSRNAIIWKLTHSKWGSDPSTIRTAALTLSYSAAEYACPIWECSKYTRKLDSTLNECCQIITGCLKPTRTDHLHILAGIAPPGIRRAVASQSERFRQQNDTCHPMFQYTPETSSLHFKSSFISSTAPLNYSTSHTCTHLWRNSLNAPNNTTPDMKITAVERLPDGAHLVWTIWKSLNHLRSQVRFCKTNMVKWNYTTGPDTCDCGKQQTMQHLFVCQHLPSPVYSRKSDTSQLHHALVRYALEGLHLGRMDTMKKKKLHMKKYKMP